MGAARVPRGAGAQQYKRRAEDLDEDRLDCRDVRVDDRHAQGHLGIRVAVGHQQHRRDYLQRVVAV